MAFPAGHWLSKGKILNQITKFWFDKLKPVCGSHMITADIDEMPEKIRKYRAQLQGRVMLVRKLEMIECESICRGYLTGSGFIDYKKTGELCGLKLPAGLLNCQKLPEIIFTPSTKAAYGIHDENITNEACEKQLGTVLFRTF